MTERHDDAFPPIGAYGFLSDCETAALVSPDGAVEWLCLPRFDSPSLFAALLDRNAGRLRLAPDQRAPLSRRYEPGTNVVETTWATGEGWAVVRDSLVVAPVEGSHRLRSQRMLLRLVHCLEGGLDIDLSFEPAPDYGRSEQPWQRGEDGRSAYGSAGEVEARLCGDIELSATEAGFAGSRSLVAGEGCYVALAWGELKTPESLEGAEHLCEQTAAAWRRWLERGEFPDHLWRAELQRSALVLKGLTHTPTGALVAAPTTSLPETPGGERNWDYRYTWVRDATFALWGLHVLGFDDEAIDFMGFIEGVCRANPEGRAVQIMYGLNGERDLTERTLEHLSGYEGARPVRIGNGAFCQQQNDVHGALLDSVYIHSRAMGGLDENLWEIAAEQVEAAVESWEEPDQGIWEARGEPKHYVSSKLMCWVALERGARLAELRSDEGLAKRWRSEAERIREQILTRGVSERGVFRQHYETDALDASTLLVPLVRFLPGDDERVRNTVLAIAGELTERGLVLRYRVESTDDGLEGEEGTFAICSFWLVSALSEIGQPKRARRLCERLLTMGGSLDLYAEEIDSRSGRQLGNFPQAFTHLGLINAVSHVIADERGRTDDPFQQMRERT